MLQIHVYTDGHLHKAAYSFMPGSILGRGAWAGSWGPLGFIAVHGVAKMIKVPGGLNNTALFWALGLLDLVSFSKFDFKFNILSSILKMGNTVSEK